jgi:glutathione synthase/RimK-type ligase-like ATP-grasp enzyme
MKEHIPTIEQCELALKCCEIIGLDFAGVDLLFGEQGEPILCEINSNAHFKNIYDCTGVNAAEAILSHIIVKLRAKLV